MKEKKYKSLWSRKKVKAQLVTLLIVSSFFLNAFAQESSMSVVPPPDEVLPQSPLSEIDQPPSPLPVSAPEKSKTNEEKATQTIKVEKSKVYLDFRDTDIKDVARILSKISGVSMLVGENVKAKVTLNIEGVSWEKALELILKTYNLGSIKKDNFIIIVTYKEIQDQQDQIPLTTKIITLNFASLDDTKTYVKSMMTKRGTIETDKKTNSLIITDTPETIERILKITSELDKKTPQVLIEVWMIDKSLLSDWDFGIDWQVQDKNSPSSWTTENDAYTYPASITQKLAPTEADAFVVNYGKSLMGYLRLGGTLKALQKDTNSKVLANPRILTLDNVSAEITITDQIPYTNVSQSTESSSAITSTQFKDATTRLTVKPHITPDNNVIMEISTEQGFKSGEVIDDNGTQPLIATRKSTNTMIMKNQETVVLGGLRARTKSTIVSKIPVLGDIPIIGKLFFQSTIDSDTIRELIIFVTPVIVRDESLKMQEREEGSLEETKYLLPSETNKSKEPTLRKLDPNAKENSILDQLPKLFKTEKKLQTKKENTPSPVPATSQSSAPDNGIKKDLPVAKINVSTPNKTIAKVDKKIPKQPNKKEIIPDFKRLKMLPLINPDESF